jgi:hypothetical protein
VGFGGVASLRRADLRLRIRFMDDVVWLDAEPPRDLGGIDIAALELRIVTRHVLIGSNLPDREYRTDDAEKLRG